LPERKKCQFKSRLDKNYTCPEFAIEGSDYCIFHKPDKTEEEIKLFEERTRDKVVKRDYDFTEFIFAKDFSVNNNLGINVFEKKLAFGEQSLKEGLTFWEQTLKDGPTFGEQSLKKLPIFRLSLCRENSHLDTLL